VDEPALRKRFERIKARLRKLAEEQGVLGGDSSDTPSDTQKVR
jgi:hypothetical protein